MGRTLLSAAFDFDLWLWTLDAGFYRSNSNNFRNGNHPRSKSKAADEGARPTHAIQLTSIFSSTSFLSFSSLPVSSNELVSTALPFSTLVMT